MDEEKKKSAKKFLTSVLADLIVGIILLILDKLFF